MKDEQERTRQLILATGMYTILEDVVWQDGHIILPARAFLWPIVFWDSPSGCYLTLDEGEDTPTPFTPFQDMNAAWQVLRYAVLGKPGKLAKKGLLLAGLFGTSSYLINPHYGLGVIVAWTPEMICNAILRAYGVEGV